MQKLDCKLEPGIRHSLESVIDLLCQAIYSKKFEVELYKQAVVAKGTDAQQMLKASVDDIIRLKTENARLKDVSEVRNFEQRYCTLQ